MKNIIGNERGSVMNIALLMLILLTLITVFMSRVSTTNVQIAGNERSSVSAFYNADAGAYGSAKIVGLALALGRTPVPVDDLPGLTHANDWIIDDATHNFYRQVMGFDKTDVDEVFTFSPDPRGDEDIEFYINGREVNVGITRTGSRNLAGGGAEFGAGSMGIGSGSAGGVAIHYEARSAGEGSRENSSEVIVVQYRKIPGTAGGL